MYNSDANLISLIVDSDCKYVGVSVIFSDNAIIFSRRT